MRAILRGHPEEGGEGMLLGTKKESKADVADTEHCSFGVMGMFNHFLYFSAIMGFVKIKILKRKISRIEMSPKTERPTDCQTARKNSQRNTPSAGAHKSWRP